ncbi:MAG TPA: hypothetical protein PLC04_05080 [Candidatus Kapabacteria bacterium]|jgi:hypothetical protein|nr:hypothetical protein [Candidatus Kapabacteria bacterium]HOV92435.1 hypothetical protein [Candidatus Kapabacteria bacterium]
MEISEINRQNQLLDEKRIEEANKYEQNVSKYPQQQLQIEMLKQASGGNIMSNDNSLQKQLLQIMAAIGPQQQIQQVAQAQIAKGFLDIKI